MSQIIIDLCLTFKIPETNLTINSLIYGLKESCQQIHGTIITSIMKALEERLIETFSDGGPGIEENLLCNAMSHQRCQWHGKRDFPYLLYAYRC